MTEIFGTDPNALQAYRQQTETLDAALLPQEFLPDLVDGLLTSPSLNVWYGNPGSFKTGLLMSLALSVASGQNWLPGEPGISEHPGFTVRQRPVLWVDVDSGKQVLRERFGALARGMGIESAPSCVPLHVLSFPQPQINALKSLANLAALSRDLDIGLTMIDTLLRVSGAKSENDPVMDEVMSNLRQLSEWNRGVVQVISHPPKGTQSRDTPRGHSSIEGGVDTAFKIDRQKFSMIGSVVSTKVRQYEIEPFEAVFRYDHIPDTRKLHKANFYWHNSSKPEQAAMSEKKERVYQALVSYNGQRIKQIDLLRYIGGNHNHTFEALQILAEEGKIKTLGGGKGKARYYWVEFDEITQSNISEGNITEWLGK